MNSRLAGLNPDFELASADLGEPPLVTFWRVTVPLALPGIIASLLLTFTVSFDEFILSFFLSSNSPTLPVFMWSQMRFSGPPADGAGFSRQSFCASPAQRSLPSLRCGPRHDAGAGCMTNVAPRSDFIQINAVRKQFGPVVALNKIDLEIGEGEFFSLLGHRAVARPPC